jgi:CheY-like chemotaxis protein
MIGAKGAQGRLSAMGQVKPLKPATVLLVEDELLVQLDLVHWLSEQGLNVLTATTADEAIELLDRHPEIALLLTDIQMPGSMDGIRLAHYVAKRWPPIKIVVLSGRFNTQLCELPRDCLFIPKPYLPEALLSAIGCGVDSGARS